MQSESERIYDRIVISWTAPDWAVRIVGRRQMEEGTFRLDEPRLYVDGQMIASRQNTGRGPVIFVYLPGQGRFLIALDPQSNPLFTQAGHVNGNVIEFQSGGRQFRIICRDAMIASMVDRPVFVYHQQSFENLLDPTHPRSAAAYLGTAGPASLHRD